MKAYAFACLVFGLPLLAQDPQARLKCEDGNRRHGDGRAAACQIRESTIAATGRLSVDAGVNGGVAVSGWSRNEVLVRAKIQTWAPTEAEAQSLQSQVSIATGGSEVRASAPDLGRERGYAVSYEVFVPRRHELALKAHNGGVSIEDVNGGIEFETMNGGVNLRRLAGRVKGHTVNGGLKIELAGNRWDGEELDARTTNGGVSISLPDGYSARLEASTVNGGFQSDVPMSVSASDKKRISATLGSGGALVRVTTTNGGIHLRRS